MAKRKLESLTVGEDGRIWLRGTNQRVEAIPIAGPAVVSQFNSNGLDEEFHREVVKKSSEEPYRKADAYTLGDHCSTSCSGKSLFMVAVQYFKLQK